MTALMRPDGPDSALSKPDRETQYFLHFAPSAAGLPVGRHRERSVPDRNLSRMGISLIAERVAAYAYLTARVACATIIPTVLSGFDPGGS